MINEPLDHFRGPYTSVIDLGYHFEIVYAGILPGKGDGALCHLFVNHWDND
jgi:hypothetical protein